jgi:hypothetical protein
LKLKTLGEIPTVQLKPSDLFVLYHKTTNISVQNVAKLETVKKLNKIPKNYSMLLMLMVIYKSPSVTESIKFTMTVSLLDMISTKTEF